MTGGIWECVGSKCNEKVSFEAEAERGSRAEAGRGIAGIEQTVRGGCEVEVDVDVGDQGEQVDGR